MANSISDAEYVFTREKFGHLINTIQGPEDLVMLQVEASKKGKGWHGRRITDMDGDGIEDNEKYDHDTLDEFYDPLVFGVAEDINNTRHGNLPGHKQLWFTETQVDPVGHWQDIVQDKWEIK